MRTNPLIVCATSILLFGCASDPASSESATTHSLWEDAPRLQLDLPPGFSMRPQEGPDFEVFHFSEEHSETRLGVYVGYNPGLFSRQAGGTVLRHPGRVAGVAVEWLRWSEDGRQRSEALVAGLFDPSTYPQYAGIFIHVFASASSELEVARMEAAAATLRLDGAR